MNSFPGAGAIASRDVLSCTIIAFSHLRWDGVFQRPQHILSRLAKRHRVYVWEEPHFADDLAAPRLDERRCPQTGVTILTPWLRHGTDVDADLRSLVADRAANLPQPLVCWYYTPMMRRFSADLPAQSIVYDCMDELSAFLGAPPELLERESELFAAADVVFCGGPSIYRSKMKRHGNVHCFRSSVDQRHFRTARTLAEDECGPAVTVGYCGVIDERVDLGIIARLAAERPDWRIEIAGPIVKIDPASVPQAPNLHWLGQMAYADLPALMAGWNVALMPFALNEATRFISPTKTPEYLSAGLPVVSTAIRDVVDDYGHLAGVRIADANSFVTACDQAAALSAHPEWWLAEADAKLASASWQNTVDAMEILMIEPLVRRSAAIQTAREHFDVVIVGAGFAGSVMAERLAADAGKKVLVLDRRPHIAGNAYDRLDEAGILIHQYGPHIFHTNSEEIFAYLSRFTKWRPYEHRVLADVGDQLVPMPINRTTLNALYGLDLQTDEEAAAFLASRAEPVEVVRTSRDVVVSAIGTDLYERFFQGYTRKQWALDPSELDKSVTSRVPTRTNTDDRYFTDKFQAMPLDGYTEMFRVMLDHPNIELRLGVDFDAVKDELSYDHLVYTGAIDAYFGYRFGKLPYRSLSFDHQTHACEQFQPVATVNYPAESVPYTRITEYKHLTGQVAPQTSITYEYPCAEGDPYYPVPRPENQALYKQYEALANAEPDVSFVGRLATYRYYNMDQVVGQALATYRRLKARWDESADAVPAPMAVAMPGMAAGVTASPAAVAAHVA